MYIYGYAVPNLLHSAALARLLIASRNPYIITNVMRLGHHGINRIIHIIYVIVIYFEHLFISHYLCIISSYFLLLYSPRTFPRIYQRDMQLVWEITNGTARTYQSGRIFLTISSSSVTRFSRRLEQVTVTNANEFLDFIVVQEKYRGKKSNVKVLSLESDSVLQSSVWKRVSYISGIDRWYNIFFASYIQL